MLRITHALSLAVLLNVLGEGATALDAAPGWTGLFVQMGSFGLVCFVMWYVFTKYLPQLQETFRKTVESLNPQNEALRAAFEKAVQEAHAREQGMWQRIAERDRLLIRLARGERVGPADVAADAAADGASGPV